MKYNPKLYTILSALHKIKTKIHNLTYFLYCIDYFQHFVHIHRLTYTLILQVIFTCSVGECALEMCAAADGAAGGAIRIKALKLRFSHSHCLATNFPSNMSRDVLLFYNTLYTTHFILMMFSLCHIQQDTQHIIINIISHILSQRFSF